MDLKNGSQIAWQMRITIAALVLPLLFVASLRPVCWLATRDVIPQRAVTWFYGPLVRVLLESPNSVQDFARWYSGSPARFDGYFYIGPASWYDAIAFYVPSVEDRILFEETIREASLRLPPGDLTH